MDVGSQYYGSYGWCWTDKATTTWGICDESCPMVGHLHNLDQKIDKLNATVHKHHKDLVGSMKKLAKEAGVSPKVVEEAEEPKKEPAKKADVTKKPKKPEDAKKEKAEEAKKEKAAEAKDAKEEKAQDAEEKKMEKEAEAEDAKEEKAEDAKKKQEQAKKEKAAEAKDAKEEK